MSRSASMKGVSVLSKDEVMQIIEKYMRDIDDDEFFSPTEISKFVEISIKRNMDKKEIVEALDFYSKDYGEFS